MWPIYKAMIGRTVISDLVARCVIVVPNKSSLVNCPLVSFSINASNSTDISNMDFLETYFMDGTMSS